MNSGADWLGAFYEVFLKYVHHVGDEAGGVAWGQDDAEVLRPVGILQEHLVERAQPVRSRVHGRPDVQVIEFLNRVHESLAELDVVVRRGWQGDFDVVVELGLPLLSQDILGPRIDVADKDGRRPLLHVWSRVTPGPRR